METHLSLFLKFAQLLLRSSFSTALLLIILFPLAALSQCYYPDGSPAVHDVPCNTTRDVSACCGAGWACLYDDNLCQSQDDPSAAISRGSCTDHTWESVDCPWPCKDKPSSAVSRCDDQSWCCQPENEQSCCLGVDLFLISGDLDIPISTIQTPLEPSTQIPITTVHEYSTITKQGEPSIETMVITKTATPLKSITPRISQIQTNETTLIQSPSAPSDFFPGPKSSAPSTIRSARSDPTTPSNAPTSAARHITPKTGVGLGVGLCVVMVATITGIVAWGVRKHRRKALSKRKLKISQPISVKSIPMFEVANTDWELPVNREMPAELSANQRTGRTWI